MAGPSSITAVVVALLGNAFVTAIKLIAFALSGSGAMLSEAIHSAADTGNQLLLFIGLKRSEREPDDRFHYGYSGERFVFGMLSAAGIFFLGCGITIFHGIESLLSGHVPNLTGVTFLVLAASFVIEGGVLLFAIRSINKQRGDLTFFRYVRERADPATVAILLEDGAAVTGLVIAAGSILLAYATGNPMFDAIGSIVVGVVLGFVAFYLVRENRELLLGRAIPEGLENKLIDIMLDQPAVRSVRDVKTRQLTPDVYSIKAELTLDNDYLAEHLERAMPATGMTLEGNRRGRTLRRLTSITTDRIATEIAAIEDAIRAVIPQARHIDLEVAHPDAIVDDEIQA
jgi:solute carrier family 30 (zinc transporter), member 9